ncbi:MAG: hypothetical protein M0Z88_04650 [Actinomycetota bacterium]|nr:hypothetical protein [Actinomycetota bacterium]
MEPRSRPALAASTRFQAPTYEDGLVSRDRLIDQLRAGKNRRLVLIHGPAGFGKTTLAVQWQRILRADDTPVAWLSLDRDDNDSAWFVSHVVEAMRKVEPKLSAELVELLDDENHGNSPGSITEIPHPLRAPACPPTRQIEAGPSRIGVVTHQSTEGVLLHAYSRRRRGSTSTQKKGLDDNRYRQPPGP